MEGIRLKQFLHLISTKFIKALWILWILWNALELLKSIGLSGESREEVKQTIWIGTLSYQENNP
jgi:hypothetical protein